MINKLTVMQSDPTVDQNDLLAYRDSAITRFEICFKLGWKFIRSILKERFSIITNSPTETFRECLKQNLITADESNSLHAMVDDHTATTNDEEVADLISERIASHYKILCAVAKRLAG